VTLHQMLNVLSGVLVVALLIAGMARADDGAIRVTSEQGSSVARFKVGDSRCVLKDDQVRCAPISK
jgi:serine/threonine protein phosphatase PrpC